MEFRKGLVITGIACASLALFSLLILRYPLNLTGDYSTLAPSKTQHEGGVTRVEKDIRVEQQHQDACVTIFIHGNIGLRQHLSLSNIIRFTKDDVHGTQYAKAVSIMRDDPLFFKMQAMQELGLQKMDPDHIEPGYASGAMACLFETLGAPVHDKDELRHYYSFGWSGITTESARHQAGRELYHALSQLVITYKKDNMIPKLRIIGYSHGGNVGLNLGAVTDYTAHPFVVDELVLLGTPILVETDHLIQSEVFKRVYHLYSQCDRVQNMDCFSSRRFFSKKTFKPRASFEPPAKLRQIEIRVTDTIRAKLPSEKGKELLVTKNKSFISGKARFLRDRSPGHFELWCFGWTPQGYRKNYPLYPLPTVCLAPLIIAEVEAYLKRVSHEPQEKLVVDFRPAYGQMIVRKQNNCDHCSVLPFLTLDAINELGQMLMSYIPPNFTEYAYQSRVKQACNQAKAWQKEKFEKEKYGRQTLGTHTANL